MADITNPIRFVAFGKTISKLTQVQVLVGPDFDGGSPYYTISGKMPLVVDLAWFLDGQASNQFKLHSQVGAQHKHEGPYVYGAGGGVLIASVDDASQAHFADFDYVGP